MGRGEARPTACGNAAVTRADYVLATSWISKGNAMSARPLFRFGMPWTSGATALAALACTAAIAMTGDNVASQFRGTWVPATATCEAPLKVVIDANVVTFVNGAQRAEFRKLEQCFSCMGQG